MKNILFLLLIIISVQGFSQTNGRPIEIDDDFDPQVTFKSWNINNVVPGSSNSIEFTQGISKLLNIDFVLRKPESTFFTKDAKLYLRIETTTGTFIKNVLIKSITGSSNWGYDDTNPNYQVYSSSDNSINLEYSFSQENVRAFLFFDEDYDVKSTTYITFSSSNFSTNSLVANAGEDILTFGCVSKWLNGKASGKYPPYTYSWSPCEWVSSSSSASTKAYRPGTYTLTVIDSRGGYATDQVVIAGGQNCTEYISGSDYFQYPCPNTISSRNYYLSDIRAEITDIEWSTSYGSIVQYYYSGALKSGIKISSSTKPPLPQVRISTSENDTFTITCTITHRCGTKSTKSKTVTLEPRVCPVEEMNLGESQSQEIAAYPNPSFNKIISLDFSINEPGNYSINIVDNTGKNHQTKVLGYLDSGFHRESIEFQKSGIFMVILSSGFNKQTKRVLIMD